MPPRDGLRSSPLPEPSSLISAAVDRPLLPDLLSWIENYPLSDRPDTKGEWRNLAGRIRLVMPPQGPYCPECGNQAVTQFDDGSVMCTGNGHRWTP